MRNIMAIVAIILTTALFSIIFTLGISTIDAYQYTTMKQAGGDGHLALRYINDEEYDTIKDHPLIKEISYSRSLADSIDNEELLKRHGALLYKDELGLDYTFYKLLEGHWPQKTNELAMDSTTLQLLKIKPQIGSEFILKVNLDGEIIEKKFVLSGFWESDASQNSSVFFASEEYLNQYIGQIEHSSKKDFYEKGVVATIKCNNSYNLDEKLEKIITESGYVRDDLNSDLYIDGVVKWSNVSSSLGANFKTIIGLALGLALIVLTGYLLIYNIFQISVVKDIRHYGLLKSIGTTNAQIKKMIRYQSMILTIIGLPFGFIGGVYFAKLLVPMIVAQSNLAGIKFEVSLSPLIFIATSFFVALTVWLSIKKPAKLACNASPIETVHYTDISQNSSKRKPRTRVSNKVYKLAWSNVLRNKKQFFIVLISLSLCLVMLNSFVTIINGFDMNKYLSKFVDTDFYAAQAEYFKYDYRGEETSVDESFIKTVSTLEGFEDGGRLYHSPDELFSVGLESKELMPNMYESQSLDGNPCAQVFGNDSFVLSRFEVIEGQIDPEKYATGNYIIEGIMVDENGTVAGDSPFKVGEEVIVHNYRGSADSNQEYLTNTYTIMAKVKIRQTIHSRFFFTNYIFYLPKETYLPLVADKSVMSYMFNVKDEHEADVAAFLDHYTSEIAPTMDFESKAKYVDDYGQIKQLINVIGVLLTVIIGLIGFLNLINTQVTSIITRYHEFALMESIGMTRKQLRNMLCFEGLYYALATIMLSSIFALLASVTVVQFILDGFWFMNYQLILYPILLSYPILIWVSILIPIIAIRGSNKESVSERLVKVL